MFDLEELLNVLLRDDSELDIKKVGPTGFYCLWRDSNKDELARLLVTTKSDCWNFEILVVKSPRKGFLGWLCFILGNYAVENNIQKFYIKSPYEDARQIFLRVGFVMESSNHLVADTRRIKEYGDWIIFGGAEPAWHKN